MEHEIRQQRLHISEVPVRLDGLDPQTAREVADLLPGAIRAAVAGGGAMPQAQQNGQQQPAGGHGFTQPLRATAAQLRARLQQRLPKHRMRQ